MQAVQSPVIPIVAEMIRQSPGTISLGQGVVSYGPPAEALRALETFPSAPDDHRYGPVEGTPELVEAIRVKLERDNGVPAGAPDRRVVVTAGSNMGFMSAVLAVTSPGDEVILPAPFYFNHEMAVVMAGCGPVAVPTDERHGLDPDAILAAVSPRTRAVVTISPNNPSGAVYPEAVLREVNTRCGARGLYHIHDEAYEYFTYGQARHWSPASSSASVPHTISLYSMSKTYGMASWRIGYMAIPAALFEAVNKIQDTILICPPAVSQRVALAALGVGSAYCRDKVRELAAVRQMVLNGLGALAGLATVMPPDGAFYCLVRVRLPLDPLVLVSRLIREHRVAAVPGTAFGLTGGCWLRISYGALAPETVAAGLGRLVEGIRAIALSGV